MKKTLVSFSRGFVNALRKHLKQGPRASSGSAREMGREAVAFGLETLDLARIHEAAIGIIKAATGDGGMWNLLSAEAFFTHAIIPIEVSHYGR